MKKAFKVAMVRDGSMCFIPVPFDPKAVFGKVRAPVKVTLKGYTYRSTIASMGDGPCVPLRKSHREAAGLSGDETLTVTLELDREVRDVELPPEVARALAGAAEALRRWRELSYSHRRELVDAITGAKRPETRARRVEALLVRLGAPPQARRRPAKRAGADAEARGSRPRPRLNAAWHEQHPMPKPASDAQRLAWHVAHEQACGCRPMPESLRRMKK